MPANSAVAISSWYPNLTLVVNKVIDVGPGATLQLDKTIAFYNCYIRCGKDAAIVTTATNMNVIASNTKIFSCTEMWQGIRVNAGARIDFFNNTQVSDAQRALYFPPGYAGSANRLRYATFKNNQIGLQVGELSSGLAAVVGFTQCWGNTFHQTQPLLSGAISGAPVSGAVVTQKSDLRFGTSGGPKNLFERMNYGVEVRRGAFLLVVNTAFENMAYGTNSGSGIHATNAKLQVTRAAGNDLYNCVFTNNQYAGIFVQAATGPTTIEYSQFSGPQDFGIHYRGTVNKVPVTIRENHFTLWRSCFTGIYLERPPSDAGQTNSLVSRNTIVVSNTPPEPCRLAAMINIVGNIGALNRLDVEFNKLANYTPCENTHGIYVSGQGDSYRVRYDTVEYLGPVSALGSAFPEHAVLGIVFTNMPGDHNEVFGNYVRSLLESKSGNVELNSRSFIKCGIHVVDCNAPAICANDVSLTYRGFHFGDLNPGTNFGANKIQHHVFGLYCGKTINTNTNIGNQVRRANTWSTSAADYIDGGVGARYADGNFVPFQFFYDPFYANHVPPSANPLIGTWFVSQAGNPTGCGDITIRVEDSDIAIAQGTYPAPNAAAAWDYRRQLWYKLTRHPELADDDADVWAFYNNSQGSSEQQCAGAQYQYEQAFMPAPALSAALDSLYAQHAVLIAETLALDAQIGQDTTNLDETAAAALETKWTELAALNLAIADALDIYAFGRNALLQAVQATVDELPGMQTYESSWGTILSAGIKKGQELELDAAEIAELLAIAQSCPAEAGTARQVALSYLPVEDAAPYLGREPRGMCGRTGGWNSG
ncbi:MAG: right-handed parallel beta-helix repeat-containing protein [Saprospirales bacterium]|nr:right-handed parallel beta-helix repeat-containing protein [Saprospirales bacterium]